MRNFCSIRRSVVALVLLSTIGLFAAPVRAAGVPNSLTFAAADPETKSGTSKAEGEKHEEGIPPWQTDLALWSLIVFLLFVFVLRKFAWGPLIEALNKREAKVRQDIAAAEDGRKEIERMLAEHRAKLDAVQDEVREILAEARRDAEHAKQEIVSAAQSEAEAMKQRSIGDIERARDSALDELFGTMAAQVSQATEFVLGRSVSGEDQDRLIQEAMSQFSQGS